MSLLATMRSSAIILFLVVGLSCTNARRTPVLPNRISPVTQRSFSLDQQDVFQSPLLELRGGETRRRHKKKGRRTGSLSSVASQKTATGKKKAGAAAKEKEKGSTVSEAMSKYKKILPLTRIYISAVVFMTVMGMVLGEELTQTLLALDPVRVIYGLEFWRPLTAATFLGTLSMGWFMSGYYLFQYGSSLEGAYGSAQFLIFLLTQVVMLSFLSALLGQPFFASSVITAMLHVLSRSTPNQKVKWIVFNIKYWMLPYCLMAGDVMQAKGNLMAMVPHILGILSGHFYYFHKYVWPKIGGQDWLEAPDFLVTWLEPKKDTNKAAVNSALKARTRGRGRKLGGN